MKNHTIHIHSILEAFEEIPDPRSKHGRRHPLSALLGLCLTAMLCGKTTLKDIARFGREHKDLRQALGFTHWKSPAPSTFTKLFQKLDPGWFEMAAAHFFAFNFVPEALAIDGKTLRGSRQGETPAVHVVNAFLPEGKSFVGLEVCENKDELGATRLLLKRLDLDGKIVTADALSTQLDISADITEAGGDYVFRIKANQPTLYEDVEAIFFTGENKSPIVVWN